MANLYWKPKIWWKNQSSFGTLPTFADTDSIIGVVSFSADVETEVIEKYSSLLQFLDIVKLSEVQLKASIKCKVTKELWEGKIKDILQVGGFGLSNTIYGSANTLGSSTAETYGAVLFDIDGFQFAIKNARANSIKFGKNKNSVMEFQTDVTGDLVTSGLTFPNYSVYAGTPITTANLSGKINYWSSWEIEVSNEFYDQRDHSSGAHKLMLVKTEANVRFDYDAGVYASWGLLIEPGTAVDGTLLLNGLSNDKVVFSGKLVQPALLKERDGVASQEIQAKLTSLACYHG